jgi:hypothetical protein
MMNDAPSHTEFIASLHAACLSCLKHSGTRSSVSHAPLSWRTAASDTLIHIDAPVIAESSLQSLNFHSGILLLEEYLLEQQRRMDPSAKPKATTAAASVVMVMVMVMMRR